MAGPTLGMSCRRATGDSTWSSKNPWLISFAVEKPIQIPFSRVDKPVTDPHKGNFFSSPQSNT
jgi:hypothetical protein